MIWIFKAMMVSFTLGKHQTSTAWQMLCWQLLTSMAWSF